MGIRRFLLIERAQHPGYWQSVTGSQEDGESLSETAAREVWEETGWRINTPTQSGDGALTNHLQHTEYEIWPEWRHRYAPGVTLNTEHLFSLELGQIQTPKLSPHEHSAHQWLDAEQAAAACFSPSNRTAILMLAQALGS